MATREQPIVSIDLDRRSRALLAKLARREDKEKIYTILEKNFSKEGLLAAGLIVKQFLSGQRLRRRTGNLARSITGRGVRVRGIPGMRVGVFRGPALSYTAIQEFGGIIRPKRGRALAMPVEGGRAMTRAGVDRYGGPRSYPGKLVYIPYKGRNAVAGLYDQRDLKRARGNGLRGVKAVYVLLRQVSIKPKHFLSDGVRLSLPSLTKRLAVLLAELAGTKGKR